MLNKLGQMLEKAKGSSFSLKILNLALGFGIPFNKPHGFKVLEITTNRVKTVAPYKRKNFNHIRGIHACAIATISEFATGLILISRLDPASYRIIMQNLDITYHYQAKKKIVAIADLTEDVLQNEIIRPVEKEGKILKTIKTEVYDTDNNHVATANITWQVKLWAQVKTKV